MTRAGAGNLDALLHAVYAIKTLPPDQRRVAHGVRHYIFG
jgi:hypothetical protein